MRNVGFNVKVEQIRERFQDLGELIDVVLPPSKRTSATTPDGRALKIPPHAGYAFVEFDTREQAQAAITAVNGSRIGGRPVAVDFAFDSRLYQAIKEKMPAQSETQAKSELFTEDPAPVSAKQDKPSETKTESEPAPKKQKTLSSETKTEPEPAPKKQKTGKKAVPATESEDDRKLFLVNVPFDAEWRDIKEGLCEFGGVAEDEIASVLIIKDKENNKPTGKAFVICKSKAATEKILAQESSSMPQLFGDLYKNKDSRPAVAPLEGAGCLVLGRRISIMRPLTKTQLEQQKQAKEEENAPKNPKVVNRKNIDFVNAGWINETHEEVWASLTPKDQKMRQACNEEKKFKLKNPNFVINTKRLMIRNVPKNMENGDLLQALIKAMGITGSKKKKQSGILKAAIVKDKVMVAVNGDQAPKEVDFDMNDSESENETPQPTGSGKIPMKEKKRSRGFAFVDFADSERAMRCLEATNNVPGAFGEKDPKRRPIVEFSFDDVRKLQIQQQRAAKQATKPSNEMGVKKTIEKKLSRGQKQRAKRRAEREAAAANHK